MKKRWIKRLGIAASIVLFLAAAVSMIGLSLWKGRPEWYRPNFGTPEERRAAAENAESKFKSITNWANKQRALEDSAAYARQTGTTAPATSPAEELTVSFTEQELNAFLNKWSVMYDWQEKYSAFLTDPTVVLQKDRLIIAGNLKTLGAVTSVHLAPSLDENGKLHLDLASVQAGKLPLPSSVWTSPRDKLLVQLRAHLPEWKRSAKIEPNGSTNASAMSVAFSEMLLDIANEEPTEAVLFLPLLDRDKAVPVRLTSVTIDEGVLTLTVQPMAAEARSELLKRIRRPTGDASIAAK